MPLQSGLQLQQQDNGAGSDRAGISALQAPSTSHVHVPPILYKPLGSTASESSSIQSATVEKSTVDDPCSRMLSQDREDIPVSAEQTSWTLWNQPPQPQSDNLLVARPLLKVALSSPSSSSFSSSSTPGTESSSGPSGSTDMSELPEDIAIRRAEQNRAAQRAFRQRKQKYIKWLESKAEELDEVYRIMALVRAENQQLCNLVLKLDEKLNGHTVITAPNVNATTATATAMSNGGGEPQSSSGSMGSTRPIQGIDESLGREISFRLMNLATLPSPGGLDGDRNNTAKKSQPRSSAGKPLGAKGRMAYKMSQQSKNHGELLQAALLPGQILQQPQLQQQQQQFQQQQQQQQQGSLSWDEYSPTLSTATTEAPAPLHPALPQGKRSVIAMVAR